MPYNKKTSKRRTKKISKRRIKKTLKNSKKIGGNLPLHKSIVNYKFPGIDYNKSQPSEFTDRISEIEGENIYFFFLGTGCTTGLDLYKDTIYNNIKYGATICRGDNNPYFTMPIQISTSIHTTISNYITKCKIPPLQNSSLIKNLKTIIIKLINKKNKIFLYGHSYGGTLVTRLTQVILASITKEDSTLLFIRTFGAPFINDFSQKIEKGQVLNINFEEDDISKHNKNCVDKESNDKESNDKESNDKESKSYILLKLNIDKELGIDKTYLKKLKKRRILNYFWSNYLSFGIHNSYEPIMNYIISNIDNSTITINKIKSELQNKINDKGLLKKNVNLITNQKLLRGELIDTIYNNFYES